MNINGLNLFEIIIFVEIYQCRYLISIHIKVNGIGPFHQNKFHSEINALFKIVSVLTQVSVY